MKKLLSVLIILAFILSAVNASKARVCLWPDNTEIKNCLADYFSDSVELVEPEFKPEADLMKGGDSRLMELMCRSADCEYLLIPFLESVDGFSHSMLFVYRNEDRSFSKVYENLQGNLAEFDEKETALRLAPLIVDETKASEVKAMVESGPQVKLPEVEITQVLKPKWLEDKQVYSKAKQDFYRSFAETLAAFGAKVLIKSYNINNSQVLNIADNVSTGVIAVSGAVLLGRLFNYCRYADFVSP